MSKAARSNRKQPRLSSRSNQARTRALSALSLMRREHLSLATACRLEHLKPGTFLRYVGSAVRQEKAGGRFRATAGDRLRRDLQLPTAQGLITIPVYGSRNAKLVSDYLNAVGAYLRTGIQSNLTPFIGKKLKVRGEHIVLLTDPATLSMLAEADSLRLDHLYGSFGGAR